MALGDVPNQYGAMGSALQMPSNPGMMGTMGDGGGNLMMNSHYLGNPGPGVGVGMTMMGPNGPMAPPSNSYLNPGPSNPYQSPGFYTGNVSGFAGLSNPGFGQPTSVSNPYQSSFNPNTGAGLAGVGGLLGGFNAYNSGGGLGSILGGALGGAGNAYGAYTTAAGQNNLNNAVGAGFNMAGGAYNPTLFGGNGVGGTGFSVSSPTNGGPGSISTSLGAMNPLYGQYAGAASNFLGQAGGLANTAASGAQGAYQSSLASIMPQLQQMQGNLLAANNNSLFERGQLGSGSFGQMGSGGNPVNLTTQSLGAGFAQQDLNAITAAQNQGLNFFNSNLQGAGALGNLGFGATNTGLGMINAGNALGQMPLAYSQLYGNQQIGATADMANMIKAGNVNGNAFSPGTGGLLQQLSAGLSGLGSGGLAGALSSGLKGIGNLFGGGGGGGGAGDTGVTYDNGFGNTGGTFGGGAPLYDPTTGGYPGADTSGDYGSFLDSSGNPSWSLGGTGPSAAGGEAATPQGQQQQPGANPSQPGGFSLGGIANDASNALNIYSGLQRGGVAGYGGAALSGASLANRLSTQMGAGSLYNPTGQFGSSLGAAGGALGIYNGLKQGGVTGDLGALAGAGQLYSGISGLSAASGTGALAGAGAAGAAAGYVAAPLALYGAIKGWQTGDTGGDALRGAEAGASIGALAGPIGMAAGAVIGGVVGAASSAIGNPGQSEGKLINSISAAYNQHPELASQISAQITPSSAVQGLQSLMSAETNTAGHSSGLEQVFGRNNVSGFVSQMATQVNNALQSGKITSKTDPSQVYASIVSPWLQSKGASVGGKTPQGQNTSASTQGMITALIGSYMSGNFNMYSHVGSGGETISVPALYGRPPPINPDSRGQTSNKAY